MTKFLNTVFLLALILATNSKLFVASNPINQEHGHQQSPLISHAILDDNGKFNISWDHSAEFIVFQVVAATTGYIGFGLSPTGSMTGADIFHAGVWDNGTAYHFVSGYQSKVPFSQLTCYIICYLFPGYVCNRVH